MRGSYPWPWCAQRQVDDGSVISSASEAQVAALRAKLASAASEYAPSSREQHKGDVVGILTVNAAAARCSLKPATIRKWLQRGKLTGHGYDQAGHALVALAEVEQRAFHDLKSANWGSGVLLYPAGFHEPVHHPDERPRNDLDEIDLITVAQAAHHFRVSPSAVRSWASRGYKDAEGSQRKLRALEINGCREKLYDIRDVAQAARPTEARGGRARRYAPEIKAAFEAANLQCERSQG